MLANHSKTGYLLYAMGFVGFQRLMTDFEVYQGLAPACSAVALWQRGVVVRWDVAVRNLSLGTESVCFLRSFDEFIEEFQVDIESIPRG